MADDRYERGLEVRRAVLGAEHVDRSTASATDLTRDFQTFITEYAWGGPWSRPGLDRKTRSIITLAVLAALGKMEEFELHVRATQNTGVTPDEVKEILLHTAIYAGVPTINTAFRHAATIYDSMKDTP